MANEARRAKSWRRPADPVQAPARKRAIPHRRRPQRSQRRPAKTPAIYRLGNTLFRGSQRRLPLHANRARHPLLPCCRRCSSAPAASRAAKLSYVSSTSGIISLQLPPSRPSGKPSSSGPAKTTRIMFGVSNHASFTVNNLGPGRPTALRATCATFESNVISGYLSVLA